MWCNKKWRGQHIELIASRGYTFGLILCWDQTMRHFCLLQRCSIRQSYCQKFLPCLGWKTTSLTQTNHRSSYFVRLSQTPHCYFSVMSHYKACSLSPTFILGPKVSTVAEKDRLESKLMTILDNVSHSVISAQAVSPCPQQRFPSSVYCILIHLFLDKTPAHGASNFSSITHYTLVSDSLTCPWVIWTFAISQ